MSSGLLPLLSKPAVQFGLSTALIFGVQSLVPTFDPAWYKQLKKPKWTPPNKAFPMIWIPLKIMQSTALTLAVRSGIAAGAPYGRLTTAISVFSIHMLLGNWWNVVFFGRRKLKESLTWMGTFWLSVAGSAAAFWPLSHTAGALMLPTLVWVTIAAKLNQEIVDLNVKPDPTPSVPTPIAASAAKK